MNKYLKSYFLVYLFFPTAAHAGPGYIDIVGKPDTVQVVLLTGETKATEKSERRTLAPKLAKDLDKLLFKNNNAYLSSDGEKACMPEWGTRVIYTKQGTAVYIDFCFQCDILEINGNIQKNFDPIHEELLGIFAKSFPENEELRKAQGARARAIVENIKFRKRWRDGMPKSLRSYWDSHNDPNNLNFDVAVYRKGVAKDFPEKNKRILALFRWFGSGAGPWSGYPSYEGVPEKLLLEYPKTDLFEAAQSSKLDEVQEEGAARLFGGWEFSRSNKPGDFGILPPSLKKQFLHHVLKSSKDSDKLRRARKAFDE